MIEKILILSNNPMCKKKFCKKYDFEFVEGDVLKVFTAVRDYVHKGHTILTHPLMSSIKPNETPFRTVIITKNGNSNIDMQSLDIIEQSILETEKFIKIKGTPKWNKHILEDFQLIDYDLIFHTLN